MTPFERSLDMGVIGLMSFIEVYFILAYFGEVFERLRALRKVLYKEKNQQVLIGNRHTEFIRAVLLF